MLICLEKQHKFKQATIKERRSEAAGLHIKMDCDSLNKTGSCVASATGSNIISLSNVLSVSCLALKLANGWPYHSKRFLSIISLQYFTPDLYHQSAPVSTFAEPGIRLFPR